jgi:hypothetical protein
MSDEIKGTCVKSVLGFLSREGLLQSSMTGISSPSREVLGSHLLATNWYPVGAYIELLDHVANRPGRGGEELMLRIGKQIVTDGLSTVYKVFLPVESPSMAVARGRFLWRSYFKGSELRLLNADRGVADYEVYGEAHTSPAYCTTKLGGMIGSLELIGARRVTGEHTHCICRGNGSCRFRLTWEE